jgi:ABC-2 type transport system ATP-binding protein
VREVMEITGLEDYSDRLIKNLSKGYKQRVGIAQAMLGDPDIIILDEPTVGLDPKQIIEIRELIKDLGKIKTVILSSHILAEISSVCDHIIIIAHGEIIANDTIENLVSGYSAVSGYRIVISSTDEKRLGALLDVLDGISKTECTYSIEGSETVITIKTSDGVDLREQIFDAVTSEGLKVLELTRLATSLEDVFLKLTTDDTVSADIAARSSVSDNPEDEEDDGEDEDGNEEDDDDDYKPLFGSVREEDDE